MEAFSDGIFAIASTLLVLDLAIPGVRSDVGHKLVEQWPTYLAYVVSFATIGNAWLNHSVITEYLERADAILLRLNLVLLFFVSVLPFPTHMLAEYLTSAERSPSRSTGSICWRSAPSPASPGTTRWRNIWSGGTTPKMSAGHQREARPQSGVYAVAIGIGLLWPTVAVVLYLAIALFVIIPFRAVFRRLRQVRRGSGRGLSRQG